MTPGHRAARVLVLTASYGSGHNRVAEALAVEFAQAGAAVRVMDHFRDLVHPVFDRATRSLYHAVLRRTPALWDLAYWLGDQVPPSSPLLCGMNRIGMRQLRRLLAAERPDHVVSVHPTPAAALAELAARRHVVPPHTTVFTDFVAHAQWVASHVSQYAVPADEIARDLIARGVPRGKVVVTGIPVMAEFARQADRAAARLALGLSRRLPVVLVMAGSQGGLGRLEEALQTILGIEAPLQAVVVAGRDALLEARLRRLAVGREGRVRVLGYVDHVPTLMAAADLLVSKAGALTVAEALASELPMVCFGSVPGQEARNERFAAMAGFALVAGSPAQLQRVLGAALRDPHLLGALRGRIGPYRRPWAARAVVDLVLGRIGEMREVAS